MRRATLSALAMVGCLAIAGCPQDRPGATVDGAGAPDVADASVADDAATGDPGLVGTQDDVLRLNHLQALGTHNSYHRRSEIVADESHRYDHLPLDEQLALGVRAFELDIHNPDDLVEADDFAVYHITFIDPTSTCVSLKACLALVVAWSEAHPWHVPIAIWIEPKGDAGGGAIDDLPRLDTVISAVVPRDKLLTPADVRGDHASVREALASDGWPTLGAARGKLLFCLLDTGGPRDVYTNGLADAQERLLFVGADASEFDAPWAAVAKINSPASATIAAAHAARILVASNLCLAGAADGAECAQATADAETFGSHWLKTDFPQQAEAPYWFHVPPSCNPVTAPPDCRDAAIE